MPSTVAKNSLWILVAAICFGLGVLIGNGMHSRPVADAKHLAEQQTPFPPLVASLTEQKACDEQASKRFHEDEDRTTGAIKIVGYTSHYDPKINVCFARLNFFGEGKSEYIRDVTVIDAFENREYALFTGPAQQVTATKPLQCQILVPDKPAQDCQSLDEFDGLVEKYFGVPK